MNAPQAVSPRAAAAALGVALPPGDMEDQAQALEVAICCRALELYPPTGNHAIAWAAEIYGQMSDDDRRAFASQRERWADGIDGMKHEAPRPPAEEVLAFLDCLTSGETIGEERHIVATGLALSLMTGLGAPLGQTTWRKRYEVAAAVLAHFCAAPSGQAWPTYWADLQRHGAPEAAPDFARRAIDLAIRLICDPHPLAVVADAVADVLWRGRGEADAQGGPEHALGVMRQVHARARRMLRVVAPLKRARQESTALCNRILPRLL